MEASITCDQLLPVERVRLATKVRHSSPSLAKDHYPGGHIPRVELHFPKSVESPCCDITQIKGRRSCAAESLDPKCKPSKVIKVVVRSFSNIVRKAGYQESLIELCCLRDVDRLIIDPRSAATRGAEEFITSRIIHNAKYTLLLVLKTNGYAICKKTMCEICGAVERIDNPDVG